MTCFTLSSTQIDDELFGTCDPHLAILAWTGDEISCRQAIDWYLHKDPRTQAMDDSPRRPKLSSSKKTKDSPLFKKHFQHWEKHSLYASCLLDHTDMQGPLGISAKKTWILLKCKNEICLHPLRYVLIFSLMKNFDQMKAWKKIDISFSCFVVNTEGHQIVSILKFLSMFLSHA